MNKIILITALVLFSGSISVMGQAPKVTHIYPDAGLNEGSTTAHIYGDSFAVDTVS